MSSREGVFAGYLRWCPGGIWGVFEGIWGYLRVGASSLVFPPKFNILRFALEVLRKWPWEGPAAHARILRKTVTIKPLV